MSCFAQLHQTDSRSVNSMPKPWLKEFACCKHHRSSTTGLKGMSMKNQIQYLHWLERGSNMSSTSCTGRTQVKFSDQLLALSLNTGERGELSCCRRQSIDRSGAKHMQTPNRLGAYPQLSSLWQQIHIDGSSSASVVKSLIRGYAAFSSSWFCVHFNIFNKLGSFGSAVVGKGIYRGTSIKPASHNISEQGM